MAKKQLIRGLRTSAAEDQQLLETLRRFTNACEFIAAYANDHHVYALGKLRKHPYRRVLLNERVKKKFGLHTGLTEAAIRRVVSDYTLMNPDVRGDQPREVVPTYEGNDTVDCTKDTVSIFVPSLAAWHIGGIPLRFSLATYKSKGGRVKVPFATELRDAPENEEWRKGHHRLIYYSEHPTRSWFYVMDLELPDDDVEEPVEQPDELVGESEVIGHDYLNDYTPDEEPDYTPPEDIYE